MINKPSLATISNSILERLDQLTNSDFVVRPTDNLLSEFEFKSLMRKADTLHELSEKFLLKALLHLNYNRDVETAKDYFSKAIYQEPDSLVAWTHFPAALSIRGFEVEARKYFRDAVEHVKSRGTLFNLYSSSIESKDLISVELAVNEFCKMYPADGEREPWIDQAYSFLEKARSQAEKLGLDSEAISKAITAVQGHLGLKGYNVKSVRHYFDSFREEAFTVFEIPDLSDQLVNELNFSVVDFIVENELWDLKFSLVIENWMEAKSDIC